MLKVKALHPYVAQRPQELSFTEGEVIAVTKKDPSGWWDAELKGKKGVIPGTFVEDYTPSKAPVPPVPVPVPVPVPTSPSPLKGNFLISFCLLLVAFDVFQNRRVPASRCRVQWQQADSFSTTYLN